MAAYVALLRGINLGARNKIPMARLRELFEARSATDVQTYLQSGNVVFRSTGSGAALVTAVEQRIAAELGLDVRVLLRTSNELARIVDGNPFRRGERSRLHVTFLGSEPERERVRALDPQAFAPDEFRVSGTEVYLHCPQGYGRSKLSNAFFEQKLGVVATTRNWNTVTNLATLAAG